MLESRIITLLKHGDESCIRLLFDSLYKPLCVYALRYVDSSWEAEDVVQDVFIGFWERRKNREFEGSVRSYLYGAVHKAAMNKAKKTGRVVFEDLEQSVSLQIEQLDNAADDDMLRRRVRVLDDIEALPKSCREVFRSIVLDNMSYKDVAEKYGVSVNTVKTQYSRALKKLRGETLLFLFLYTNTHFLS